MKTLAICILFTLLAPATMEEPPGFAYWGGDQLKSLGKTLSPKIDAGKAAVEQMGKFGNHAFVVVHREGNGEAEVHETQTDVFMIVSGGGTLVVGGSVSDGRTTAPGEIRGASITGGERKKLGVGDVANIPAKMPHQVLVDGGKQITYLIVKVDTP